MADVTESQHPLLVTTAWLGEHLESPDFVLIDCSDPDAYRRAHIPSAVSILHPPHSTARLWSSGGGRGARPSRLPCVVFALPE